MRKRKFCPSEKAELLRYPCAVPTSHQREDSELDKSGSAFILVVAAGLNACILCSLRYVNDAHPYKILLWFEITQRVQFWVLHIVFDKEGCWYQIIWINKTTLECIFDKLPEFLMHGVVDTLLLGLMWCSERYMRRILVMFVAASRTWVWFSHFFMFEDSVSMKFSTPSSNTPVASFSSLSQIHFQSLVLNKGNAEITVSNVWKKLLYESKASRLDPPILLGDHVA